jgi:plasmid stabilization system protein ParE
MQNYDIRYLPIAEDDLNEIIDYLLEHSISAANAFIDELEKLEERLSIFPESAAPIRDKKLQNRGYRMAVIGAYSLFYILLNESVYVMRIMHSKRNYSSLLSDCC